MLPEKLLLVSIVDKENKCYSVHANGGVNTPTSAIQAIKDNPPELKDFDVSFDTIDKYFSLKAATSLKLTFIGDGATILRYLRYKKEGFNEEIYVVINKWNHETGEHELEYKGRINLKGSEDKINTGIIADCSAGGLQGVIDAEENTNYEFKLNASNPLAIPVYVDGPALKDTYNFKVIEIESNVNVTTPATLFVNNEGDSVGITRGDQSYESPVPDFALNGNYLFSSFQALKVEAEGSIKVEGRSGQTTGYNFGFATSLSKFYFFAPTQPPTQVLFGETKTIPFKIEIPLEAEEKLFLVVLSVGVAGALKFYESDFKISFTTIPPASIIYMVQPETLFNWLLGKMSKGKNGATSSYLKRKSGRMLSSGQAVRGFSDAILTISLSRAYNIYHKKMCLCANIINEAFVIEHAPEYYGTGGGLTVNIGEVSELSILDEDKRVVKKIRAGWPNQDYGERNGRLEFNTTNEYDIDISTDGETLDTVTEARADSYGVTFNQGKLNNKDTTDDKGDVEIFYFDVDEASISHTDDTIFTTFPLIQIYNFDNSKYNLSGGTITVSGTLLNNGAYTILQTANAGPRSLQIYVKEALQAEAGPATITFKTYRVYRDPVPPVGFDGAEPYNVRLRPSNDIREAWGSYLHSVNYQIRNKFIEYRSTLRNADFSTVENGVTISEKDSIRISSLPAPFFLNYTAAFDLAPLAFFHKILRNLQAATEIVAEYKGYPLYLLPIGSMSTKTMTEEAQKWKLLLSPKNNLDALFTLIEKGLYFESMANGAIQANIYNPVWFIKAKAEQAPGIRFKDIRDAWTHNRNEQFAIRPQYKQKWQKTDTIKLQFITSGDMAPLEMNIYKVYYYGNCVDRFEMNGPAVFSDRLPNITLKQDQVLHQWAFDLADYDEADYVFEIVSNGERLLLSEVQAVRVSWPHTYIIKYYNSKNKLGARFINSGAVEWLPEIRVEADWNKPQTGWAGNIYDDENGRKKLLYGSAFWSRRLFMGYNCAGFPDFLVIMLNEILGLDRVSIEGTFIVRDEGAELEQNERAGSPFVSCSIELFRADNNGGLTVLADGTIPNIRPQAYSVSNEGFGRSGATDLIITP